MNKYLMMCAAATMAASAGSRVALASTTIHFGSGGGTYCDYFVINKSGGGLYAAVHHGGVNCATTSLQNDAGVLSKKTKGPVTGSAVGFADTTFAKAGVGYDGLDWVLGTPFGWGAKYAIISNTNGTTAVVLVSGIQLPGKARSNSGKSALSDAIKALRLTKK